MLCDITLATLQRAAEVTRRRLVKSSTLETEKGLNTLIRAVKTSQHFVLSPLFVETASQLADPRAVMRTRDHLFAPADLTWLEWEGEAPGGHPTSRRHAILLVGQGAGDDRGHETILVGWGAYFAVNRDGDPFPLIFSYDLPAADRPILRWQLNALDLMSVTPDAHEWGGRLDNVALGTWLGAALALINTPRLAHVMEHDQSAINRSRARLNRPPILSYKTVRIMVDRAELGIGNIGALTAGRALHHVRAFLRLQRGRVQLVRPHWRGNPRFGVVVHRYVALRVEDEPGPWQGGPLPGPKIIGELEEKGTDDDASYGHDETEGR